MENNAFDLFMQKLGATKCGDVDSYFSVYKIDQIHFHFIAILQPELKTVPPDYFVQINKNYTFNIIHVWEDVWLNHQSLIENRIKSLLGMNKRIHARQTQIERIDKKQADAFLKTNHLQGTTNAYYKFALKHQGNIVAVMTMSKSRVMQDGPIFYRSYELERFASLQGYTVIGGLGKLLHHFKENFHPAHLMTYADADWGKGNGYQKLGFAFASHTEPLSFLLHPKELIRIPLSRLQPSEILELKGKGYLTVYNSGSLKFILDLRDYTS
jgi:hypothetical protein